MSKASIRRLAVFLVHATVSQPGFAVDELRFKDLEIGAEAMALMDKMPVEMETGGAKMVPGKDGQLWLVSIGCTVARQPENGTEMARRLKVARNNAMAQAVTLLNGSHVTATSTMGTRDEVSTTAGRESGKSSETFQESVTSKADGMLVEMVTLGTWKSKDETTFFLAIGRKLK